jgi:F-type H+-transporting ATPase subunit b
MDHGPVLIPDATLFVQLALFIASYFVLRFLVFKPYLRLLELRRERTEGLRDAAARAAADAERMKEQHDAFLRGEQKRLAQWTESERRKVGEEAAKILAAARSEVDKNLHEMRERTKKELEMARAELLPHVVEYSSQIASKLLGKAVKLKLKNGGSAPSRKGASAEEIVG